MLLGALIGCCGIARGAVLSQLGVARDPAGGSLLYQEQHLIERDSARIRERLVLYRCGDGTAFARKHVEYRDSQFVPDFSLTDARDGYREGLDGNHDEWRVWSGTRPQPKALQKTAGVLVADAGFDELVRAHWSALIRGGKLPIRFVVPAFDKSMALNLRSLGRASIEDQPVQRFSLKLGGLLALVSPDIEVAYEVDSRRLRRFEGISNLRSDRGKPFNVRIDFPQPPKPTDSSQWQAMLDTPLRPCRIGV